MGLKSNKRGMLVHIIYPEQVVFFIESMTIIRYKRVSIALAARVADTLCLPEAPIGRLGSH